MLQNRYALRKVLGEGAYSVVYRGWDSLTETTVAIKKLKTTGLTSLEMEEAHDYFLREIEFLKSLNHPAIPAFYDYIRENGRFYLVMELIDGIDLLTMLERDGPFSEDHAYRIMFQVADALVHLQECNTPVIYKDLKPSNIMELKNGKVKLIDFGAARFYTGMGDEDSNVLGTPGYAPPEAYGKASTNFSADVYSFGATFFHLVTGQEPFQFKFRFPSPSKYNPELSHLFCRLIQDCLKKREHRIADARELQERVIKSDPLYEVRWIEKKVKGMLRAVVEKLKGGEG